MARLPVRFRRNTLSAYGLTFTAMVLGLLVTPVLTGELTKNEYGIWALAGSTVMYLELLQLGFGAATTKYVAESAGVDDEATRRAIATSFWSLVRPALAAAVIGVGMVALFPVVFDVDGSHAAARTLVALLVVNVTLSILAGAFSGVLMAHQHHDRLNLVLSAVVVTQWASWAVIVATGGGLVLLGIAAITINLAGQAAIVVLARRLVPGMSLSPSLVDRSLVRPFTGLSMWLATVELASVVIERIDVLVVGAVLGVEDAAVYAVGVKLASMAGRLFGPATVTLFPFASLLSAGADREGLRDVFVTGTRLALGIAGPICVTLVLLSSTAIDVWVGDRYDDAAAVVALLTLASLLGAVKLPGVRVLSGMGMARVPALITALEAFLNLVLDLVLAPSMGIAGIALASLIASAICNVALFVPYTLRTIGMPVREYLRAVLGAHGPATVAALAAFGLLQPLLESRLDRLVVVGGGVGLAYLAVFSLTGLAARERRWLLDRVRTAG